MSWLSSFLHPDRGYDKAMQDLKNYFDQAQGALNPYASHGEDAYAGISEAMNKLMHPAELEDEWLKDYNESEQAKRAESMATDRGMTAAQGMGLGGSSSALQALQQGTSDIALQDKEKFLNNMLQKYLSGVGIGTGIYNTGAGAAGQIGQNAMNMGSNIGQLDFGKTNAPGDLLSKIIQGGISFATPIGQSWGMKQLGLDNAPWSTTGGA